MRLLPIRDREVLVERPVGVEGRGLCVDAHTGQVYALTDARRDELDPEYRKSHHAEQGPL